MTDRRDDTLRRLELGLPDALQAWGTKAFAKISERSVRKYMRNAGLGTGVRYTHAQIPSRSAMDTGPLRIVSGRLSRSILASFDLGVREAIRTISVHGKSVVLTIGTRVPYGSAHEQGFSGSIAVPEHERTIRQAFGRPITPVRVTVRSHSKTVNIPKRPYLAPAITDSAPAMTKDLDREILKLFREA